MSPGFSVIFVQLRNYSMLYLSEKGNLFINEANWHHLSPPELSVFNAEMYGNDSHAIGICKRCINCSDRNLSQSHYHCMDGG